MKRIFLIALIALLALSGAATAQDRETAIIVCNSVQRTTVIGLIEDFATGLDEISILANDLNENNVQTSFSRMSAIQSEWVQEKVPEFPRCAIAVEYKYITTRILDEAVFNIFALAIGDQDAQKAHQAALMALNEDFTELSAIWDDTGTASTEREEAQPSGVTVTSSGNINLRGGPGTNYGLAGTLSAGETAKAEARNGEWLYLGSGRWVAAWVVTVTGDINVLPTRQAPPAPAAQTAPQPPAAPADTTAPAAPAAQPTAVSGPAFTCDCSKTCTQMASCEEAYFQLNQCGCSARDGDGDGVPCESICPGG